jgi:hypothetical protein
MDGRQKAVLWIGLIMVGFNLALNWAAIRNVIFSGASGVSGGKSGSASSDPSGGITVNPPGQGITVPFGGFPLPIPFLSTQTTKPTNTLV